MPSLLTGYEYDVFVSYRQNDNRGGWVTEFVKSLQEELSATIKDPVSVYFDVNPHDGLLETHQVGKSLEGKLKCLIFIPVISQTYSDPKSFAWQYEFCAFNRLAGDAQFGREIRLANGNVASRILPIKIHDLDQEDQRLIENELSGPLRSIEFIYREAGVNRPLTVSDSRNRNLNNTEYRNQVNKTANAIKDIVNALRNGSSSQPAMQPSESAGNRRPVVKVRVMLTLFLLALISVSAYYFPWGMAVPKDGPKIPRIAVLPFKAIGEGSEYFASGMKEALVKHLRFNEHLSIPPSLAATDQYANTTLSPSEIAKELRADYLIRSSAQKWGDSIRLIVELIDPTKDELRWAGNYRAVYANVFGVQEKMASDISASLRTGLSRAARKEIKRIPTQNIEAYDLFLQVLELARKRDLTLLARGQSMLRRCIKLDSNFAEAYVYLAASYYSEFANPTIPHQDSIEWLLNKGLEIYPDYKFGINLKCQFLFFQKQDTLASVKLAESTLEKDPNDPNNIPILAWIGWLHEYWLKNGTEILALQYYLEAYKLDSHYKDPTINILGTLASFFGNMGDYPRAEGIMKEAMNREPEFAPWQDEMAELYMRSGQYDKLELLSYDMEITSKRYSLNSYDYLTRRAAALLYNRKYKEGLASYDEYLRLEPLDGLHSTYTLLLEKNGFREKAEGLWLNFINAELKNAEPSQIQLARCYAKLGNKERALLHFEQITFHTTSWWSADFASRDLMVESLWNEPRFVSRIKKEQDRLKGMRERLAKMEAEKIISIPQFIRQDKP